MISRRLLCKIFILFFVIISCIIITKVISNKINNLQEQYNTAQAEIDTMHTENSELQKLISQQNNELQDEELRSQKRSDEEMQKYYMILSQDNQSHENDTDTIFIKNNCLYFHGQSFLNSDPQKIDDEYTSLLEKFYKLYDITKEKITDQNLEDAGFDPWFVKAYTFAPYIDVKFDAEIICREYMYKRACFELAVYKYSNNEIQKDELDDVMNEFIKVREKAEEVLMIVTNIDI